MSAIRSSVVLLILEAAEINPSFGRQSISPKEIKTSDIYSGVIPYIFIQILTLLILFKFPLIVTWLPGKL